MADGKEDESGPTLNSLGTMSLGVLTPTKASTPQKRRMVKMMAKSLISFLTWWEGNKQEVQSVFQNSTSLLIPLQWHYGIPRLDFNKDLPAVISSSSSSSWIGFTQCFALAVQSQNAQLVFWQTTHFKLKYMYVYTYTYMYFICWSNTFI